MQFKLNSNFSSWIKSCNVNDSRVTVQLVDLKKSDCWDLFTVIYHANNDNILWYFKFFFSMRMHSIVKFQILFFNIKIAIITWESFNPNRSANFFLSGLLMYFCIWKRFSKPFRCESTNAHKNGMLLLTKLIYFQ